jgi:hypothetical protein
MARGRATCLWNSIMKHQPDTSSILRAFLLNRDVYCPECRYCLRNLESDRCPECGCSIILQLADADSLYSYRPLLLCALSIAAIGDMAMAWLRSTGRYPSMDSVLYLLLCAAVVRWIVLLLFFPRRSRSEVRPRTISCSLFIARLLAVQSILFALLYLYRLLI